MHSFNHAKSKNPRDEATHRPRTLPQTHRMHDAHAARPQSACTTFFFFFFTTTAPASGASAAAPFATFFFFFLEDSSPATSASSAPNSMLGGVRLRIDTWSSNFSQGNPPRLAAFPLYSPVCKSALARAHMSQHFYPTQHRPVT